MPESYRLLRLADCDSTNDYLKQPLPPELEGSLPAFVLAARQSAGHGRLGRSWSSPLGGIYLSLLWPEAVPVAQASALPLVVAAAVRAACQPLTIQRLAIKWPNDILVVAGENLSKLAGILVEMHHGQPIIGIGLNVYDSSLSLLPAATSTKPEATASAHLAKLKAPQPATTTPLAASTSPVVGLPQAWLADDPADQVAGQTLLEQAVTALTDRLLAYLVAWQAAGFSFQPFRQEYRQALIQMYQDVEVYDALGSCIATGTVQGVDATGRLELAGAQGRLTVASGDVTLRSSVQ